jgi:hypothetical protein
MFDIAAIAIAVQTRLGSTLDIPDALNHSDSA